MSKYDFDFKKKWYQHILMVKVVNHTLLLNLELNTYQLEMTGADVTRKKVMKSYYSHKKTKITLLYKCSIVVLYLTSELSVRDSARQENICNSGKITT